MQYFSIRGLVKPLLVLCSVLLLSACAAKVAKESTIEERVNARWAALFNKDIEGAYGYLSPGYRSSVSLTQYQRSIMTGNVRWTSAKYVSSKCEETRCDVKVLVGFTVTKAVPGVKSFNGTDYIDESWVLVKGNWFIVPQS